MTPGRTRDSGGRGLWIALGAAAAVLVLAVAGGLALVASGALTPHHTITGDYILVDSTGNPPLIAVDGSACRGTGGYADIAPGAPVTLRDGAAALLGTTTLSGGSGSATECDFTFSFANVPEVGAYTVEVSGRGAVTNALDDMKAQDWTFALRLGQ